MRAFFVMTSMVMMLFLVSLMLHLVMLMMLLMLFFFCHYLFPSFMRMALMPTTLTFTITSA
jgi:hypothetical protein